jgi:hypothetical protein
MYLRIMRSHLRGRAKLRHYRIAPTGRLCELLSARVFMQPNQPLNTSTTSLRSWCSPREVNASRSQPRERSHPWSMVSGMVSTTVGAIWALRRQSEREWWAGWGADGRVQFWAHAGGGRAAGNPGKGMQRSCLHQSPSPVRACCSAAISDEDFPTMP